MPKKGASKANKETIIPFYNKNATSNILKGFFTNKIILVEGLTEELALPIYFEKVGLDLLRENIEIINVNVKGELAKWWRFFTHYNIPVYIVFDNDNKNDQNGYKRKDALKAIGIKDNEIENLLNADDWNINEKFCVFGKDFEDTIRNSFKKYKDLEDSIKNELGDAKPLIAREVAIKLTGESYDEIDIGWQKIQNLCKQIKNL